MDFAAKLAATMTEVGWKFGFDDLDLVGSKGVTFVQESVLNFSKESKK
jgi:threonine aldolase